MSVQEVQSVVVWCRVGAVSWWYDTGGCYNDTISRVVPIFVWLTARSALQPFVAVMQTPVTRDQTISPNTLISLQYTYTVIEIKLNSILFILSYNISARHLISVICQDRSICPDINTHNAPSQTAEPQVWGGAGCRWPGRAREGPGGVMCWLIPSSDLQ